MATRRIEAVYSRVSVKSQTVLPKQVREALGVGPGDTVRYRITDKGVLIDKARVVPESDDPFAAFGEWAGAADSEAYDDL
jgi:antitoxin PrlF